MQDETRTPAEAEAAANSTNGETNGAANGAAAHAPSGAGEPGSEESLAQLEAELQQEQARYAELFDRYQRASAEFQNSRRRLEKQMADAIERAGTHVVRRLLPVIDDAELAFRNLPAGLSDEQSAWVDGFRAIQKKLLAVLDDEGVKAMAETGPFDPSRHEAVSSEPNDSVESGHIIATLRTGYEHNGTVIRPALVRVAQ